MREIEFKGKMIYDPNTWIEGYYWSNGAGNHFIRETADRCGHFCLNDYEVDPTTVGQYTGLKDKNGVKIFEGDVCRYEDKDLCLIRWCKVDALFDVLFDFQSETATSETLRDILEKDLEIIGNIFDNPELMEVEQA